MIAAALVIAWVVNAPRGRRPIAPALAAQEGRGKEADVDDRVQAPELSGGRGWINTDREIRLADLKGKLVLLDFWTFG